MRNKLNQIHNIADTFHIPCIIETHLDNSITIRPVHLAEKDLTHNLFLEKCYQHFSYQEGVLFHRKKSPQK